jgi:hypothetical protein
MKVDKGSIVNILEDIGIKGVIKSGIKSVSIYNLHIRNQI